MTVSDILAIVYVLLNNAGEDELDIIVAMEQYSKVASRMSFEKILGHKSPEIIKSTLTFADDTGVTNNTLTDFQGEVVYMNFDDRACDETSVDMLDKFRDANMQAVAFWTDVTTSGSPVKKAELAVKQRGTLTVWYEPIRVLNRGYTETPEIIEAERYMIATRVANQCIDYVSYKNPAKESLKPALRERLLDESESWKEIYLERINKVGTNRPKTRIPFRAGTDWNTDTR